MSGVQIQVHADTGARAVEERREDSPVEQHEVLVVEDLTVEGDGDVERQEKQAVELGHGVHVGTIRNPFRTRVELQRVVVAVEPHDVRTLYDKASGQLDRRVEGQEPISVLQFVIRVQIGLGRNIAQVQQGRCPREIVGHSLFVKHRVSAQGRRDVRGVAQRFKRGGRMDGAQNCQQAHRRETSCVGGYHRDSLNRTYHDSFGLQKKRCRLRSDHYRPLAILTLD